MPTSIIVNLNPAYHTFLSHIDAANAHATPSAELTRVMQECQKRINTNWGTLEKFAFSGHLHQLPSLLRVVLEDWSIVEACNLVRQSRPRMVNPYDGGIQKSFWEKLNREHYSRSAQLLLQVACGEQQRKEGYFQQAQQLAQASFDREQRVFDRYDRSNREWADVAQNVIEKQQDFAEKVHKNVVGLLTGTEKQQEAVADRAVQKAQRSRLKTILIVVGCLIGGLVACGVLTEIMLYSMIQSFH